MTLGSTTSPGPLARASASGLFVAACLFLLGGCGGDKTYEITDVRDRPAPAHRAPDGITSSDRFPQPEPEPQPQPQRQPAFRWTTPDGWVEQPASDMRRGSWEIPGSPPGDCSLSVAGGDARLNVERWRVKQMGLSPLTDAEFAALPKRSLLGAEAIYVDVEGTYVGMGGRNDPGFRLLGYVQERDSQSVFLKFVGSKALVGAHEKAFEGLAVSLVVDGGPPPDEAPRSSAFDPRKLRWTLPPGWTQGEAAGMRHATFHPGGASEVECVLTPMTGDAGGIEANVNMWRAQMGQPPLSTEEVSKLERVEVLGRPAIFVEVAGEYHGVDGREIKEAAFLGLICRVADDSLFLKMAGARDAVTGAREAFLSLAQSLRLEG